MKAVILGLALAFAATAVAPIPSYADDLSGARKKSASVKKGKRVRAAPAQQGYDSWNNNWNQQWQQPQTQPRERVRRQAAPVQQGGGQQGRSECSPDARRLCRSVLSQGDMAVLGCFKANVNRLSRACSGFLRGMGQI